MKQQSMRNSIRKKKRMTVTQEEEQ